MKTNFFAMIHRMRYINRWGLMRNTEIENIQEHSHDVAVIAHLLALVRKEYFAGGRICPDPEKVVVMALYHDLPEIITGDMPKPVKYHNAPMEKTYKEIEEGASRTLLAMLPQELSCRYQAWLLPDREDPETKEALELVKAADCFSAYIKCVDEQKVGNREFDRAKLEIEDRLKAFDLPEVRWFMQNALPAYAKSLDEINFDFNFKDPDCDNRSV
ncbi:MAG TPA: 5'-deoxynucleotidase [Clostridiaceae bacterium]|nr:5'-deoxynucleotidase [Clostridiaceae bacterium]